MPGIPENITIAGRTPATIKGNLPPLIDTAPAARGGFRAGDSTTATLLFSENFDSQPEHSSFNTLATSGVTNWDYQRSGANVFSANPPYRITGNIAAALKDGTGKSCVGYRESHAQYPVGASNNFNSDGILVKILDVPQEKLFVRFWIKFQPGWSAGGQSKLFRISSWRGDGTPDSVFAFGTQASDTHGPLLFWDYGQGDYGVRNFLALRADPNTSNYFMGSPSPQNLPRSMVSGDLSCNFQSNVTDLNNDGTNSNPPYLSLVDGNPVPGIASHDQIYGDQWNKVEFYVAMNSGAGVADGVMKQWLNDTLVFSNETMPWMGTDSDGGKLWNWVSLGGNDKWEYYPNEDEIEEWYAIKDVDIYSDLPGDMA